MKNKFYILKESTEPRQIGGTFPQIQSFSKEYHREGPCSYRNVKSKIPDFPPDLDYLILERTCKKTDVLSTSMLSSGLLISPFLQELLLPYTANIACRFFEASVEIKDHTFAPYFWFLMESGYAEYVDFDQTKFKLTNSIGDFICDIEVATYDDLLAKRKNVIGEFKFIEAKHIYLKPEFEVNNLDLFTISILSSRIIISEKLKDALELNRVSGIEIIQANVHVG